MINKFCCRGFESWHEKRGKKGFSIESHNNSLAPFKIVGLAVDREEQSGLLKSVVRNKVKYDIRVEMEAPISYCPWCGTPLVEIEANEL